jgi:hypothetical protein
VSGATLRMVPTGRYGGCLLVRVAPVRPTLSAKANALGLETREDVEEELRAQRSGWTKGSEYHCALCDRDFYSPSGARKHMTTNNHPVLRWDWY